MRGRTYAYNGIIIGVLLGFTAWAYTNSVPIGVGVAIVGSVVCFLIIRFLENLLRRGTNKASDAMANQLAKRAKQTPPSGNLADRFQTSAPAQPTDAFCAKCGAAVEPGSRFCGKCGAKVKQS